MTNRLRIRSQSELAAAVPHLMGFHPEESLVCIPTTGVGPHARIDLPRTHEERAEVTQALLRGYAESPGDIVIVAFTQHRADAERAIQAISEQAAGVLNVVDRIQVHDERWTNLHNGESGAVNPDDVSRFAADAVLRGRAMPLTSRESLARQLQGGDPAPVAAFLPEATATAQRLMPSPAQAAIEGRWLAATIGDFVDTQRILTDQMAARVLADIQDVRLRDTAWATMDRADASSHVALWSDLTRRAPEQVRDAAAGLLAFSSWLNGDGARAWVALDLIQSPERHTLGQLVGTALTNGVPPTTWSAPDPASAPEAAGPPQAGRIRAPHQQPNPGQDRGPQMGMR